VIHNYRWRLGLAEGEAKYEDLKRRLAEGPVISVPTMTLEGDANGFRTRTPVPMPRSSRVDIRTGLSRAASGTISLRKPHKPSPRRSSKSTAIDEVVRVTRGSHGRSRVPVPV
jgi:hypothetical protein